MTSSSEARVIRGHHVASATPLATPDLRAGTWTRMGSATVLGDHATELVLNGLAGRAKSAAEAQGYAEGWARGVREAAAAAQLEADARRAEAERREALRAAEHAEALAALRAAADTLHRRLAQARADLEEQVTGLALAVTEAVLGAAAAKAVPEDVLRRAVDVLPADVTVALRVHPDVAASPAVADLGRDVTVVADPTLGRADAVAELDDQVLDLRVDRAAERVRRALG